MSEKKCGTDDNCTIFSLSWKKVKIAVADAMKYQKDTKIKFLVSKPMTMHRTLVDLVDNRIVSALKENEISLSKDKVEVRVMGEGSMEPNAGSASKDMGEELRKRYKNVDRCYLDSEEPNIEQGIQSCQNNNPDVLVIVFYFQHEGRMLRLTLIMI